MGNSKKPDTIESATAPAVAAMMAVNPVAAKAWSDIMAQSARFLADRLQQDLQAQKAFLECKSPDEVFRVQADFVKTAMAQYSEEATRMAKMLTKATEDVVEDAKSGHARGYDDIPL